jgi:hypothetical protein
VIVQAVAQHLKNCRIELKEPGAWRDIPCIGDDSALYKLAVGQFGTGKIRLDVALKNFGSEYKAFGIILANGDVVTPQALIDRAREKTVNPRRATRAGLLRAVADARAAGLGRPTAVAGEEWKDKELWTAFEDAQREAKARARRGGKKLNRNQTKRAANAQ